jgi:hypothetical protein
VAPRMTGRHPRRTATMKIRGNAKRRLPSVRGG